MLCRELVGRDVEVDRLRARLADLPAGRGGLVALVGEAGAGKTRLLQVVADAAEATGVPVLSGRAVPGASPVPYRPLQEAVLGAVRGATRPAAPPLEGFEVHLGRLVPSWATTAAVEGSPLLLAEAVVRLLVHDGGGRGAALLLEDVHWADPETVEVLEYLADALRTQPVLCVCTSRPGGATADLLARLERRDPGSVVRVDPLGETDVVRMVGACLATAAPPAGLSGFVRSHSDGNPFLVEELLAGLVAAGELREAAGHWEVTGSLTPSVPATLRDSIHRRLAALDGDARRVLGAAALLGRHFEWELLPGIAEVDGRAAADALRAAVQEQLIEADGDGFVFRHALTREAVLADLLPPERRQLAARAWPVVERANAGLPGPTLELAADLAEAAGERAAAAERLVESARRALHAGAFATAEATARRARLLAGAPSPGDLPAGGAEAAPVLLDADEVLVHVLTAAGKAAEAVALARRLADRLAAHDALADAAARRADVLVALARAAVAAGDLVAAREAAGEARAAVGAPPGGAADAAVLARVDAVAAEVALDEGDAAAAEALSRVAAESARATDQPAVECEALLVLGRALRATDVDAARRTFVAAADVAVAADLTRWHLRARHEVALEEWVVRGAPALEEMRELAGRYGAHVTVAVMDLSLADIAFSCFDREATLRHALACVDASRRYGLATEAVANLWLAGGHALAGDDAAMQAAIDAALAKDPDDPRILADVQGRVLLTRALVRDELDTVRPILDEMVEHVRRAPPHQSVYPGRIPWVFLRTMDDDDLGAPARAELAEVAARIGLPWFDLSVELAEAIALGRAGDAEAATARAASAHDALSRRPLNTGIVQGTTIFVAAAAIRDGWGEPVRWLREADSFLTAVGQPKLARRCRTMIGEAGAPVPRRRGDTEVPLSLRALGVTGREVDVLKLVVDGRSNKEIAEALVLSPKTVERHLSSLFARLGVANRRSLADAAANLL